jgi:hypothetical protein
LSFLLGTKDGIAGTYALDENHEIARQRELKATSSLAGHRRAMHCISFRIYLFVAPQAKPVVDRIGHQALKHLA